MQVVDEVSPTAIDIIDPHRQRQQHNQQQQQQQQESSGSSETMGGLSASPERDGGSAASISGAGMCVYVLSVCVCF